MSRTTARVKVGRRRARRHLDAARHHRRRRQARRGRRRRRSTRCWPSAGCRTSRSASTSSRCRCCSPCRRSGLTVVDGQQVFLEARRIKTAGRDRPAHPRRVDGRCRLRGALRVPASRASARTSASAWSPRPSTTWARSTSRASTPSPASAARPHPHVYSDRIIRPGDPAFFDILHSYNGYRTCYYRTFAVGQRLGGAARRLQDLPRVHGPGDRDWSSRARRRPTSSRCGRRPRSSASRRGGGLRPAVRPRRRPVASGSGRSSAADTSFDAPRGARGGHGLRPRDLLAGQGRLGRGPHRGGGHRHARTVPRSSPSSRPRSCWSRASATTPTGGPLNTLRDSQSHRNTSTHAEFAQGGRHDRHRDGRPEDLKGWYEQILVIRATEKAAFDLFMSGLVKGTTHLAAGHEAVAVGTSAALNPDDFVWATYRGHHHAMARGLSAEACLAELMSKATGSSQGKGGSMHLTDAPGQHDGLVRHHRLPPADGGGRGVVVGAARVRAGVGRVLRRRRDQHRRLP